MRIFRSGCQGFRGAASPLNQSQRHLVRGDSVYTGLICYGGVTRYESASCDRGKCRRGAYGRKWRFRRYDASSLTRSLTLRPFGCGGRYLHTDKSKGIRHDKQGKKRMRRCRFSIGSAPLTSITKSDAQISGGETRQDYKDTRRFPLMAPSCALLFLPFGLPVSFRCYGRVYLIPRLTLSSG